MSDPSEITPSHAGSGASEPPVSRPSPHANSDTYGPEREAWLRRVRAGSQSTPRAAAPEPMALASTLTVFATDRYLCTRCWNVFDDPIAGCPTRKCNATMPSGGWPQLPYRLDSRYVLDEPIGRGGMGAVFRAFDERGIESADHGLRAIKVVQEIGGLESIRRATEMFDKEPDATQLLGRSSENFVRVFGASEEGCRPCYMVMEFVDMPTLARHLKSVGERPTAFSLTDVAQLGREVLGGLAKMHANNWVHRDLKPDNIFATCSGHEWRVKIADLGIWVMCASAMGSTGMGNGGYWAGTDRYMSPEQARRQPLTLASDVYTVGAILWEVATGQVPRRPRDQHDRRERPREMSQALFEVLDQALAWNIDARPTAVEMQKHLDNFIRDASPTRTLGLETATRDLARLESVLQQLGQRVDAVVPLHSRLQDILTETASLRTQIQTIRTFERPSIDSLHGRLADVKADTQRLTLDLDSVLKTHRSSRPSRSTATFIAGIAAGACLATSVSLWRDGSTLAPSARVQPPALLVTEAEDERVGSIPHGSPELHVTTARDTLPVDVEHRGSVAFVGTVEAALAPPRDPEAEQRTAPTPRGSLSTAREPPAFGAFDRHDKRAGRHSSTIGAVDRHRQPTAEGVDPTIPSSTAEIPLIDGPASIASPASTATDPPATPPDRDREILSNADIVARALACKVPGPRSTHKVVFSTKQDGTIHWVRTRSQALQRCIGPKIDGHRFSTPNQQELSIVVDLGS